MTTKTEKANLLLQNIDTLLSGESSVELTQTTRGTNWKIKIYHPDPHRALDLADSIYKKCESKYGGNHGKSDQTTDD